VANLTLEDVSQRCVSLGPKLRGTMMLAGPPILIDTSRGVVAFEWHSYCGPMPVDRRNGNSRSLPPSHPFWNAVQRWLEAGASLTEGRGRQLWASKPKGGRTL
jgi:hypothetical protein